MNADATHRSQPLQTGWTIWAWPLALAGVWFWTFRSTALWWSYAPAYEYGFVVPWIAILLAWQRIRRNPACLDSPLRDANVPAGWLLPGATWAAFLFGELLRQIDPVWRAVHWLFAFAATGLTFAWLWRRGGPALVREMAFPILFTWTALPWPDFVDDPLTIWLRDLVTFLTVNALDALDIHAIQQLHVIWLDAGPVGVEDACSGIVSFHSSLMVTLFLGEFLGLNWIRRVVLVIAGCAIAVAGNLARTVALCWYVNREGTGAVAAYHDRFGFYASAAIFVAMLALAWLLARGRTRSEESLASPGIALRLFTDAQSGGRGAAVLLIAFAIVPALGGAWFAVQPDAGRRVQDTPLWAMRPQPAPAGWRVEPIELLESQKDTLGFTIGEAYLVRDTRGAALQIYHFFWAAERSGLPYARSPENCVSYIGWAQPGPARNTTLPLHGADYPARCFRLDRDGQEITALYTFWRGGVPAITNDDARDKQRDARLPLLLGGQRLSGTEHILIAVAAPGGEDARIRQAGEVAGKIITRIDAAVPPPSANGN